MQEKDVVHMAVVVARHVCEDRKRGGGAVVVWCGGVSREPPGATAPASRARAVLRLAASMSRYQVVVRVYLQRVLYARRRLCDL